jgi:hypothetical protein
MRRTLQLAGVGMVAGVATRTLRLAFAQLEEDETDDADHGG